MKTRVFILFFFLGYSLSAQTRVLFEGRVAENLLEGERRMMSIINVRGSVHLNEIFMLSAECGSGNSVARTGDQAKTLSFGLSSIAKLSSPFQLVTTFGGRLLCDRKDSEQGFTRKPLGYVE